MNCLNCARDSDVLSVLTSRDKGEKQWTSLQSASHHLIIMSNIKLTYFNGRGRGETARLVLAYAAKEYEDRRVSFGKKSF